MRTKKTYKIIAASSTDQLQTIVSSYFNNATFMNVQIHGGVVIKITSIEHYYQAISYETEIRTPIMEGKKIDYL